MKATGPVIAVRAGVGNGRAPIAVLQRGDADVGRVSLIPLGPYESWEGTLDAGPGDYRLTVSDGTSQATIGIMARSVPCFGGERRLLVHEIGPGRLVRVGAEPRLEVPRWRREDQDYSFVVEWVRDGKLAYEVRGRTAHVELHLNNIEGVFTNSGLSDMCSHAFGEVYTAPTLAPGSWEVRVHREGAESVSARFEVTTGEREIELPFAAMASPGRAAARFPRASCSSSTMIRNVATGETSGYWSCGETDHSHTGAVVAATAAEYRALMRDPEVFAIRQRMAEMLTGEGPLDRPDFEYDAEQSPDANWHRRKAWESRDSARHFANERTLATRARKHRPALAARVKRFGDAWTAEEIPAPMPGWPAR